MCRQLQQIELCFIFQKARKISTISCFLMSVLHYMLLYMCVCSYTYVHIHGHIHNHAQRAEAKYSLVRKSLNSLIKGCVTALNEKSGPFPFVLHIETAKEMSLIVFMLKDSTFPFDIVFYLSSFFII